MVLRCKECKREKNAPTIGSGNFPTLEHFVSLALLFSTLIVACIYVGADLAANWEISPDLKFRNEQATAC